MLQRDRGNPQPYKARRLVEPGEEAIAGLDDPDKVRQVLTMGAQAGAPPAKKPKVRPKGGPAKKKVVTKKAGG